MNNLTQNLKEWRKDRNIKSSNTKVFIENILEELLEIYYADKEMIKACKNDIINDYFCLPELSENNTIDAIKDIKVLQLMKLNLWVIVILKQMKKFLKKLTQEFKTHNKKKNGS